MNKRNIQDKKESRTESRYTIDDEFMFFFKELPTNPAIIEKKAFQLLDQAINDNDMLTIEEFYSPRGISSKTYYKWVKEDETFGKAHTLAKSLVANRRYKGAMQKKLDFKAVNHMQHQIDDAWDKANRYHAELAKKEEDKSGTKIVVVEKYPETDIVPEKK